MALSRSIATKKLVDAINAELTSVSSATITDATTLGQSLLTAASASAAQTALGATTLGQSLFTAASASAAQTALGVPALVSAPLSATAAGVAGSIAYDSTHIYVCVATNTWVRAVLATF